MKTIPWPKIRALAFDIDDTFSTDGQITSEAFNALWALSRAGFFLVPITGRPAGWCDHIARFWPVDAVIGENGAFALAMVDGKLVRSETLDAAARAAAHAKLAGLRTGILREFPEARFASDQPYREYDLAVDFCEDVPAWPSARVDTLIAYCEKQGAHAKLSSIHVNTWFGDYTKRTGFEAALASGVLRTVGAPTKLGSWMFVGDSPNDEPMFEFFEQSAGVANLRKYLGRLRHKPTLVLKAKSGAGFVELSRKLLAGRKRR